MDTQTTTTLTTVWGTLVFAGQSDAADLINDINSFIQDKTDEAGQDTITSTGGGVNLKGYGNDAVRYYGAIGGDLAINANLHQPNGVGTDRVPSISVHNGTINNVVESGSVVGGIGGSAALGIGKVEVSAGADMYGTPISLTYDTDGQASTSINGSVITDIQDNANVIGWSNGGLAIGLGGTGNSTVADTSTVIIDGTERVPHGDKYETAGIDDKLPQVTTALNVMKGSGVSAIGVTGGGTAVTTLGGTATSTVGGENGTGTTTIDVDNATVIGIIGGGAAASVDVTGAAEAIIGGQRGNDDMSADLSGQQLVDWLNKGKAPEDQIKLPDELTLNVKANEAINGGTATATTGETNISLNGSGTAAGVIGGGAAVASHTYTYKADKTNFTGGGEDPDGGKYSVNDEYGTSIAESKTGKSHITVNLTSSLATWEDKQAMLDDVKTLAEKVIKNNDDDPDNNMEDTQATDLADFSNKGAAVGVFGGGAAIAQSGNRQFLAGDGNLEDTLKGQGAYATAATDGAEINLLNGYIAGVMGGGVAGTINNATAAANMTGTVDITVGGNYVDDDGVTQKGEPEVVGVFGNGLAYFTGSTETSGDGDGNGTVEEGETTFAHLKGTATASAKDTNINVRGGTVDGVIGGGMAIDDSDAAQTNAIAETSGKATINVTDGTVKTVNAFAGLNDVLGEVNPTKKPDIGAYVDGVKAAAGNAAIAAGGIALGGGAEAYVNEAEVNIAGGEVKGDIYGGGIAAYGYTETDGETKGSHVGNATINLLDGGKVEGNIYAGGAAATRTSGGVKVYSGYDQAIATVDTATVNLAGADVTGILYGTGTVNAGTENATVSENDDSIDSTMHIIGANTLSTVKDGEAGTESSKIQKFDNVKVDADSVTKVEGLTAGTGAALIDGGKVMVDGSAKLDISALDKSSDNPYHIAANTEAGSTFWTNTNLLYDRTEGYANGVIGDNTGFYDVTYEELSEENASDATKEMVEITGAGPLAPSIQDAMAKGWKQENGITAGGKQFFSDWSKDETGAAYGRAAMIGEDAAVTGNTVSIARDMADNVMQRLSFTDDYVQDAGWVNNDGGIWAKYIHRKYETDNMGSSFGGIHSSTDYDGAIVGVDFKKDGKFQSGIAFHYGSGDGDGVISHNDYDAWGFTLYGSIKDEEAHTNLMADVGYVTSDNDIDGTVNGKSMSADRDVDAWTIGLRGEKEYVFGQNQLIPYVGLRYMSVNPARYSVYYDGQKAFNADADNQNLWLLPIGVSFRNETVTDGGWRITPKLDLSYIWAFGDTDTDMTLDMGGVGSGLYYDVMDDNSWLASLGVEATKDVWSFGVGYGYQKGDDTKNKTWFVNASYAF